MLSIFRFLVECILQPAGVQMSFKLTCLCSWISSIKTSIDLFWHPSAFKVHYISLDMGCPLVFTVENNQNGGDSV